MQNIIFRIFWQMMKVWYLNFILFLSSRERDKILCQVSPSFPPSNSLDKVHVDKKICTTHLLPTKRLLWMSNKTSLESSTLFFITKGTFLLNLSYKFQHWVYTNNDNVLRLNVKLQLTKFNFKLHLMKYSILLHVVFSWLTKNTKQDYNHFKKVKFKLFCKVGFQ